MHAIKRQSPCPCRSGLVYRECCLPLHRGEREAPNAEALMRSRYAAFAAGDVDYLIRTLHPEHADAQVPREALRATLTAASKNYRYTGLTIEAFEERGDEASVRFLARVYERGVDRSFREASRFRRTAEGWRYLDGETLS